MKKRIIIALLSIACALSLLGVVFVQTEPIDNPIAGVVSLDGPSKKIKRGKTFTAQVRVDLTGVKAPGSSQLATLGSYVIPIAFDRAALEFVSAGGGDSLEFASAPQGVTSAQTANTNGVVTLVGAQTGFDGVKGTVGVASVSFRVIATNKGRTTIEFNPELAAPGLSLASTARSTTTSEPYRIAASGKPASFKIK